MKRLNICLVMLAIVLSCNNKPQRTTTADKLREYVYKDELGVLHTKLKCKAVAKESSTRPVKPIRTEYVDEHDVYNICSVCFTEKKLKQLYAIIDKRWLFDKFKDSEFDVGNDYKSFDSMLIHDNIKREWIYRTAKKCGYEVGDSYEEFLNLIGIYN